MTVNRYWGVAEPSSYTERCPAGATEEKCPCTFFVLLDLHGIPAGA